MAESDPNQRSYSQHTETVVEHVDQENECPPVLTMRLQQPERSDHRVRWSSDTVDNEFMGKKKSKCCCIYEKPKVFGESDTSSSDEEGDSGHDCTPNCHGHKKKCYRHGKKGHHHDHDDDGHSHGGQGHHHHHHYHQHGGRDDNGAGPSGCPPRDKPSSTDNACQPNG